MNNHTKKYIFRVAAMFAVISFVACSGQEQGEEMMSGGNKPLQITGASAGITTTVTRAGNMKELTDPTDAIGVFLEGSNGYTPVNNKKYTYGTPAWVTEGNKIIMGVNTANLVAYYPFEEDRNSSKVLLNSDVYAPEKEFYYQAFQSSYASSILNLNLKRAYALIRFSIIRGEADNAQGAYQGDGEVTEFRFTTQAIKKGELDMFTSQLTGTVTQMSLTGEVPFNIGTKDKPVQKNFLMVPVELFTSALDFAAVVDGKSMGGSVSASALAGTAEALKAGYVYEIKLIVRPTGLVVEGTGISEEAWDVTDITGDFEIK